jgi:hypothetical protein
MKDVKAFVSREGMQRRAFAMGSLGFAASFSSLGLLGCGGGGDYQTVAPPSASSGTTLVKVAATVALPAGFSAAMTSLRAGNILGTQAVAADGSFQAQVIPGTPSLVYVQDASGNVVLAGFVDPSLPANTVNAVSSAVALLYFGMDAYGVPSANRSLLLQLLAAHPATAALAAVVAARLAADPQALVDTDAQIVSALKTAVAAIVTSPNGTAATATVSSARGARAGRLAASPLAAAAPLLVSAQPTGLVGGTEVIVDTTVNGFAAVNHFRRFDRIYVYQSATSVRDGSGTLVRTPVDPVLAFAGPIDLPSTQQLSLFTALGDLFSGTSPWSPVTSASIPLTLAAGADATDYDIVVLGSSASQSEPAFFSLPQYANVVTTWRTDAQTLWWKLWAIDGLLAVIADAAGVASIVSSSAALDAAAAQLAAITDAAWLAVRAQVLAGDFGAASLAALRVAAASDIVSGQLQAALSSIVANVDAAAATALSAASFQATVGLFLRSIVSIGTVALGALGTIDMGAAIKDASFSNQGDLWTATVLKPTVSVNPPSSNVDPGTRVTLTASLPTSILGTVVYDWNQTGTFATLSSSSGIVGNQLSKIPDNVVDLVTSPSDQGTITVTVTAYQVNGTTYAEIGKGQATVTLATGTATGNIGKLTYVISDPFSVPGTTIQAVSIFAIVEWDPIPNATSYYVVLDGQQETILTAETIAAGAQVWDPMTGQTPNVPAYGNGGMIWNLGNGRFGWYLQPAFGAAPDTPTIINSALTGAQSYVATQYESHYGKGVPVFAVIG